MALLLKCASLFFNFVHHSLKLFGFVSVYSVIRFRQHVGVILSEGKSSIES